MLFLDQRMVHLKAGDKISYDTARGCVVISRDNKTMLFSREKSEQFPIFTADGESLSTTAVESFVRLLADLHGLQIKPQPNGDPTKFHFVLVTNG